MAGFGFFPEGICCRGEPDLRPDLGSCVITRTRGMAARESELWSHALFAKILGNRPPISPARLLSTLESWCGIDAATVKIEVTSPPDDFFIRFKSIKDCDTVLYASQNLHCDNTYISFSRWNCGHGSSSS